MKVLIETDLGNVEFLLDHENAPVTAAYFEDLISRGQLDETSFFRIVTTESSSSQSASPIEVLQCGRWVESATGLTKIEHESTNETGLLHRKWSLSVARYGVGEVYGSFFICMRDEPVLDYGGTRYPDGHGFAVFGEVLSGFSVLEKIYVNREPCEFQQRAISINRVQILS